MPSNLPSSFASAAAGQNANRDSRGGRGDGRGAGGDWSRRDGRSANGTLTFRRSSTTPTGHVSNPPPSHDNAVQPLSIDETPAAQPPTYEPGPSRYTKDELLDMFRSQNPADDPSRLFMSGWNPTSLNGGGSRGWGKSGDNPVPQEPGACWDQNGDTAPLGLLDLSAEEKEAFLTEINSPLKPPAQNKEGHQANLNGRKSSVSHGSGNTFGVNSPSSATRPGTRRRETMESNPFGGGGLVSPTAAGRFSREDSSAWLPRKSSELRESEPDDPDADQGSREALGKLSTGGLARANTAGGGESHDNSAAKSGDNQNASGQQSWRPRPRTDTDPFGEAELSGSAVLGGSQDTSVAGNPHVGRVGVLGTPIKGSTGDFGMSGLSLGGQPGDNGPVSPSETNPYRSPPNDRNDHDEGDPSGTERYNATTQNEQHSTMGSVARGFGTTAFEGSDRSQTSSVGPKGYSLGSLSGWPATAGPSVGTPDRERPNFGNVFGNSLFSPVGDLQSPGLSNLSNVFGPAGTGGLATNNISRGSKLGSLFPPAMQAQMQSHEHEHNLSEAGPDPRQGHPLGAIGRGNMPGPVRDTESPMRSSRGMFEELFPSSEAARSHGSFSAAETPQPPGTAAGTQSFTPVRQMVMPDRMRWVYLDPQGQVQGPFTGLEMNDWYKANFFTPDLRVKKVEDPEFEPLGQLIRRIGNSREPFLVPQIGIPHGPPAQGGPFTAATNSGGVVPPLSGVFPSFGRTLTAEEQNNLERRKQEEQYLMAQQREFMLRQQAMTKFQIQGGPGLQHHSSAHSLQSQPSFGSMASPIGIPPQQSQQPPPPPIGSMPPGGYHELSAGAQSAMRVGPANADSFRPDDMVHLSPAERQVLATLQGGSASNELAALQQRGLLPGDGELRSGLPEIDQLSDDPEGFRERLQEFEELRALHEAERAAGITDDLANVDMVLEAAAAYEIPTTQSATTAAPVQKTQAAAAAASQPAEPDMPMPFPPPSSSTPLPAPTAQRVRSNLPEQYSRSQSGTPDAAHPPPLAPWAKDPGSEGQKGPSLKEIQEAEARKAAKAEEAAAAVRKAAIEQEAAMLREKERQASVAAGLPSTSTWGHGSPVSASSPWAKPGPAKGPAPGIQTPASSASKKTLAEIQREEEVRKQKARDVTVHPGPPAITSKSYANLAGKPNQTPVSTSPSPAAMVGSGWATVGAGGKVKAPTGPVVAQGRSLSTSNIKTPATVAKPAPKTPTAVNNGNGRAETTNAAAEEFNKWVRRELSRGLTNVTDISEFQGDLEALPLDTGVIADAVYINSKTMDGRHFAEEYVRRKKLADKGVVEKQPPSDNTKSGGSSGGWSEVAKRSGSTQPKDNDGGSMQGAGFKVVPSRKKGKK
ncbi:GYF domain-containing protein [Hirsutella rhossiliensis]|uniref:GYF domain-containing protein n=1 Tax=Hirsutella rhossiliensis TaxID=111463 RepID=A0A9P8SG02_9HYPO|nr:GYF domain-containing protein [Hirsutella rhossiliensis]KAH0959945.1 GYF domain-containing protein [Hirsutella rhossiliensis]